MESKKFRRSKEPSLKQLEFMAENVSKKLNTSCNIEFSYWHYISEGNEITFNIYLVPGFKEDCTQFRYKTWEQTVDQYLFLIKSKNLEVQSA